MTATERRQAASRGAAKPDTLASRYELGLGIFVAVLAFLGRDNPNLVYPHALYLFLLLMSLNLGAGFALRTRVASPWPAGGIIAANCATIGGILAYSGGADSNLWVLFLLPIFTACLLLGAREAALVTATAVAINGAFALAGNRHDLAVLAFELLLKAGLFSLTALVAWRLASRDRDARDRLDAESRRADGLETRLEASSALSEVGLVGAGVAHDLRNTFTAISGFAEMACGQEPLSPEARGAFERIRRMAELGGQIAQQLLRHGAAAPLDRAPEYLGMLAASVAKLVHPTFLEKQVELLVDAPEGLCPVLASRVHLQRLFLNLLLNALSVSAGRGRVRLSVRRDGAQAVAEVEDDGPGFPAEVLSRLFGAYETTRASTGGTGLGLNLCHRIAKQHDGSLAAENRPEGGARLTLRLPLASGAEQTAPRR